MKTLPKDITGRICKGIRAFLNWDQRDLSGNSEVGLSTIRNLENNKVEAHPNPSTILSIATAFEESGVTVEHNEDKEEVIVTYKYGN